MLPLCDCVQGKSSLCDELCRLVVRRRGLFARARLREGPSPSWTPILQALRELMLHLIALDGVLWRVRLLRALDAQTCSILAGALPEFDSLLGSFPAAPKLAPQDRQTRTRLAIVQLVAALSTPDSPLCLCVDDLHLAHADTLQLLQQLQMHECAQSSHLLLVCTYQPVDPNDPLAEFIRQVKSIHCPVLPVSPNSDRLGSRRSSGSAGSTAGGSATGSTLSSSLPSDSSPTPHHCNRVIEMELAPLSPHHIAQLLSDSFPRSNRPFDSIASVLHTKTRGTQPCAHC